MRKQLGTLLSGGILGYIGGFLLSYLLLWMLTQWSGQELMQAAAFLGSFTAVSGAITALSSKLVLQNTRSGENFRLLGGLIGAGVGAASGQAIGIIYVLLCILAFNWVWLVITDPELIALALLFGGFIGFLSCPTGAVIGIIMAGQRLKQVGGVPPGKVDES